MTIRYNFFYFNSFLKISNTFIFMHRYLKIIYKNYIGYSIHNIFFLNMYSCFFSKKNYFIIFFYTVIKYNTHEKNTHNTYDKQYKYYQYFFIFFIYSTKNTQNLEMLRFVFFSFFN